MGTEKPRTEATRMIPLNTVRDCYYGSSGQETLRLYDELAKRGASGDLAVLLFRAQKASARAKKYRGRNDNGEYYRDLSYDRKGNALEQIATFLDNAGCDGTVWGWKLDDKAFDNAWVLYVDLPCGQVSFHSKHRYAGPDYQHDWDQQKLSETRVIRFCELVLAEDPQ